MDQVILFDKSLQQRLREFNDVLSDSKTLQLSEIDNEFSFYLDLVLDAIGWQAIWKIPRNECESMHIPFPSIVLALVVNVNFECLQALVKVIAVQDDIHIPEKHYVPLVQLWPTKEQDKSVALNLMSTASALDMLRFFHNHILMPWDNEDMILSDWKSKHLETRLRLYYDMKNGLIPRATGEHIHGLISEGRRLKMRLIELETKVDKELEFQDEKTVEEKVNVTNLAEIHLRLTEIQNEMEIFENTLLRNVVIKRQMENISHKDDEEQRIWLICNGGTVDNHISFLNKVKPFFPNQSVTFDSSLATKLEQANPNDVYILNESKHIVRTTGALETGGILKGIGDSNKIILASQLKEIMLDFIGGEVLLENLTIDASSAQVAILVRRGKGVLKNCKIIGNGTSSTQQGIIVLANAQLEMINTEVLHVSTALIGNSGSNIKLEKCTLKNVHVGLKIYDKCELIASQTTIRDCRDYGMVLETENNSFKGSDTVGDFDILKAIPDVKMDNINGVNNGKGDVAINQKSTLKPCENLFENDLDPTIIESDSEMETSENDVNVTVLEKCR